MRPVRAAALYLLCVFLGGALLAPWVYHLSQKAATVFPVLESIAAQPFPRYVNRVLLVLALGGLWWFLRAADLCSRSAMGLGWRPDAGMHFASGFLWGLVSLAVVVLIVLACGARDPRHGHGFLAVLTHVAKAGLTAMVVAPLEELFFRGALFGALRKTFHWVLALLVSSVIYALLHFLERDGWTGQVRWLSGFLVLGAMGQGLMDLQKIIPGFLNLTLAGIILGYAYQRYGTLHFSIGLHAGWIFWLKTYGFITQSSSAGVSWFFGTSKLINGWLAFIVLGLVLAGVGRALAHGDGGRGWKLRKIIT